MKKLLSYVQWRIIHRNQNSCYCWHVIVIKCSERSVSVSRKNNQRCSSIFNVTGKRLQNKVWTARNAKNQNYAKERF